MKAYGIEAELINFPFRDHSETIIDEDGIEIVINNGVLSVGFDKPKSRAYAEHAAQIALAVWNLSNRFDVTADFDRSWSVIEGGSIQRSMHLMSETRAISSETVTIEKRVNIEGVARIVSSETFSSKSFANGNAMRAKAAKYSELRDAIRYYHFEVATQDQPLYGIYKAVECLIDHLAPKKSQSVGRQILAAFLATDYDYVNGLMQTANSERHANPKSTAKLDVRECKERLAWVISEYASRLSL